MSLPAIMRTALPTADDRNSAQALRPRARAAFSGLPYRPLNSRIAAPVSFGRRQEFEDLLLALGAARSGLGVALAPRASIEDDLARNILTAPFGFIRRPAGYSLCCRTTDLRKPHFTALRDWLVKAGEGTE